MNRVLQHMALALLAIAGCTSVSDETAVRPDGMILNRTLEVEDDAHASWPLWVTRRGEYYVELMLEGTRAAPAGPQQIAVAVSIDNDGRELLRRERVVALDAARPATTLFWFTSDREVPLKTAVDFNLALASTAEATPTVRVQVRRKQNPTLPRVY